VKITAVKAFPVWVGHRNQLIIKIETDEGIFGWGESGLSGREKAVVGAVEHYEQILIGKDPFDIGRIWQMLYRSQYFEGGRVLTAAQSAIDIALYDIKGKALGVPVYELLGGKHRNFIPTFASTTGITESGDETIEQAKALIARGWSTIRFFPAAWDHPENIFEPRESVGKTAKFLIRAREELGDEVVLGIDYHHRLNIAETASFCQKMPSGTIDFLEEPLRDETPEAYESLRTLTDVQFAIGEEFSSKWQFLPYIERGIHQYNRLDLCNVGGFTEAMKVAGWSEAHYVDLMPHNPLGPICTAATIHFSAATPNFFALEVRANATDLYQGTPTADLFPQMPMLDGAVFQVPTGPGLGIEINEEKLTSEAFRFWEAPKLVRRDGSVTNW
jgi:galactonate dehydratase